MLMDANEKRCVCPNRPCTVPLPPPVAPPRVCSQVELTNPKAELRLLQVFYNKIYKVGTGHGSACRSKR